MITCEASISLSLKKIRTVYTPLSVSGFMMMSPFTIKFCKLGRSLTYREQSAKVLTRVAQKPWNVSAFSHHALTRMSSPLRPWMSVPSRSVITVSRWSLWIKNANGIIKLCGSYELWYQLRRSFEEWTNLGKCSGGHRGHASYHGLKQTWEDR